MNGNEKQCLDELLLDISCLDALIPYIERVNIFDILKSTQAEIKHSNMLAWLLDANENHGLGEFFINKFVRSVVKDYPDSFPVSEWAFLDYSTEKIIREWGHTNDRDNNDFLDILILFNDSRTDNNNTYLIAIENKINAEEGKGQTKKYYDAVMKAFPGAKKMFLYMTPSGIEAKDEHWVSVTYAPVKEILNAIKKDKLSKLDKTVKVLIENYYEILRRDIMSDELQKLCTDIYNKHPKAFDLIFNNKIDNASAGAEIIQKALKELADEDEVVYDSAFDSGKTYVRFGTKHMDKIFPESEEINDVWTKEKRNHRRYFYELHTYCLNFEDETDVPLFLTLTLKNKTENFDYGKITGRRNKKLVSHKKNSYRIENVLTYGKEEKEHIEEIKNAIKDIVSKYETEIQKYVLTK